MSETNNFLMWALIAVGVYYVFFKKDSASGQVSRGKVVDQSSSAEEIAKKVEENAAKTAKQTKEIDDDEITVPIVQTGLVDVRMSGKELLGLQDGAGTFNPL